MNEDDSDQLASLLMQMGYRPTSDIEQAGIVLLNTCSVRAKPEQKVRSKLGELAILKQRNPDIIIGVCGCMAQRLGARILKQSPYVDIVIGTAQSARLPDLLDEVVRSRRKACALDLDDQSSPALPSRTMSARSGGLKAFVPVMYGCDNYCYYCVVPFVRGRERSRLAQDVINEMTELAQNGCREVTLLGQNVNSYSGGTDFAGLLELANDVPGIERIRFTTSHPKDLSDRLISAIAGLPKVCKHLHLPVQSGDDEVLRRMNRGYTSGHYIERVFVLRDAVPKIALTTDILVGFPGETDLQFANTLDLVRQVRFDGAFMFAFNPIHGTVAADMDDQVESTTKSARLRDLITTQNAITIEKNAALHGEVYEVLVEGTSPRDHQKLTGLTRQNKTVNFDGPQELIGHTARVRAVSGRLYGFTGDLCAGE